jgi:chromosome segregation ATPase
MTTSLNNLEHLSNHQREFIEKLDLQELTLLDQIEQITEDINQRRTGVSYINEKLEGLQKVRQDLLNSLVSTGNLIESYSNELNALQDHLISKEKSVQSILQQIESIVSIRKACVDFVCPKE